VLSVATPLFYCRGSSATQQTVGSFPSTVRASPPLPSPCTLSLPFFFFLPQRRRDFLHAIFFFPERVRSCTDHRPPLPTPEHRGRSSSLRRKEAPSKSAGFPFCEKAISPPSIKRSRDASFLLTKPTLFPPFFLFRAFRVSRKLPPFSTRKGDALLLAERLVCRPLTTSPRSKVPST